MRRTRGIHRHPCELLFAITDGLSVDAKEPFPVDTPARSVSFLSTEATWRPGTAPVEICRGLHIILQAGASNANGDAVKATNTALHLAPAPICLAETSGQLLHLLVIVGVEHEGIVHRQLFHALPQDPLITLRFRWGWGRTRMK